MGVSETILFGAGFLGMLAFYFKHPKGIEIAEAHPYLAIMSFPAFAIILGMLS